MFVCYICDTAEPTVEKLRAHLQRHNVVGELQYPILCHDCKCSFATVYNLIRHVGTFHSDKDEGHAAAVVTPSNFCVSEGMDRCSGNDMDVDETAATGTCMNDIADLYKDLEAEGISLVAGLRANSSVPFSIVPAVVQSFNSMSGTLVSLVQAETVKCLVASGVESGVVTDVKNHLENALKDTEEPLAFLSSRYKQDSFFDKHQLAVKPESVLFGTNFCSHAGTSKLVYESFEYVSVTKTLQSLMQRESFVKLMLEDDCTPGVLKEFTDGSKCKNHFLFGDSSKMSIMIQLFYDGLGVTNPLRGHSTLHNVGVFFYTIKNIPHRFNSCFANVHLLALCYAEDLKKYGFGPVLEKFVAEMNVLSKSGFVGTFPVIGEQTIYVSLCQVTCDNLALNGILGFIESFSCDYFCSICYASQDQMQTHYREEFFDKRTVYEYSQDVMNLNQEAERGRKHVRGVKTDSLLNQVDGFHVTDNWSLDIMHIVLEGIVPIELGCILHSLCIVDKAISFDALNRELYLFWGKITVEKTHKPLQLNKLTEPGQGLAPTMKAMQYWTFLKYLPLILGRFVASDNKNWHFLLHLSHVVDLIFAPKFTTDMITYLRSVVEDHLTEYISLYGNQGAVKLRPKHHFLVHLPTIILKCGPLIGMSCLRYELKNSFFKRSAHIVCNFNNICRTLAYRHQQRALFSLLADAHCHSAPLVALQKMVVVSSLPYGSLLCDKLGVVDREDVSVAVKVSVASVEYKVGQYIVIGATPETGSLVFGKILKFVSCSHSTEWCIVVETLKTIDFWAHFHAYCVRDLQPVVFELLSFSALVDHHPLYCHSTSVNGVQQKFIRVPYHIFKLSALFDSELFTGLAGLCRVMISDQGGGLGRKFRNVIGRQL